MTSYNLKNLSALCIEEHVVMRRIMRDVLKEFGFGNIYEASKMYYGFKMVEEISPDLVFCDWSPLLDGVEFIRQVRTSPQGHHHFIPIIMVTAFSEIHQVTLARDAGMTEFMIKPISADLIYKRICAVIEKNRVFIDSQSFFGPDRRRHRIEFNGINRRNFDPRQQRTLNS